MNFVETPVEMVNIFFSSAGVGICFVAIAALRAGTKIRADVRRYFRVFFATIAVYSVCHLARQVMDSMPGSGVRIALHTAIFLELATLVELGHLYALLTLSIAMPERLRGFWGKILIVPLIVELVLLGHSQATGFCYYFDALNHYHRTEWFFILNLPNLVLLIFDTVLLVRHKEKFNRYIRPAFWNFIISPVAAIVLQLVFRNIELINIVMVASALFMFYKISSYLANKYEEEQKENARIESELSMAASIQESMLPHIFPPFRERDDLDLFASMTPAKEVGGDFYDFFLIDHDHLGLVMADVSGKGVPASLFMMAVKILLQNQAMMSLSPAETLERANRQICAGNKEEMFVTVWIGVLDLNTGRLVAANAGHEFPIIRQPDGDFEILKDKHGLVVGAMESSKYTEYEVYLKPHAKIFLYTDGVPEATNAKNELFGMDRLLTALRASQDARARDILGAVNNAVSDFVKDAPQFDDLTMMCVEFAYEGESAEAELASAISEK